MMHCLAPIGLAALLATTACGSGTANSDPRSGPVYLNDARDYKVCDGSTLVYHINRGGNAIPNSPECQR